MALNEEIVIIGITVSDRVRVADWPSESFTKARTVNVPAASELHTRELVLEEAHPVGRPVKE